MKLGSPLDLPQCKDEQDARSTSQLCASPERSFLSSEPLPLRRDRGRFVIALCGDQRPAGSAVEQPLGCGRLDGSVAGGKIAALATLIPYGPTTVSDLGAVLGGAFPIPVGEPSERKRERLRWHLPANQGRLTLVCPATDDTCMLRWDDVAR